MRKGKHSVYMGGAVYQDGKPIGLELVEENYFASQNDHTRYASVLTRYNKETGTMDETHLDYDQTQKLLGLMGKINAGGNSLSKVLDWMARQTIRPTLKQNILSLSNYAAQSFFVDVSKREQEAGQDPFNFLVAETIQILFELTIDCIATDKIDASNPEKVIREGFEQEAKALRSKINIKNIDQFFDDVEATINDAIRSGKSGFKGITSAAGGVYNEVGQYLAREIKADHVFRKKLEGESTPELTIETYEFIQKRLAKMGIQMEEPPEVKFAKQLVASNREKEDLKVQLAKTSAGETSASLENPRREAGKTQGYTLSA